MEESPNFCSLISLYIYSVHTLLFKATWLFSLQLLLLPIIIIIERSYTYYIANIFAAQKTRGGRFLRCNYISTFYTYLSTLFTFDAYNTYNASMFLLLYTTYYSTVCTLLSGTN